MPVRALPSRAHSGMYEGAGLVKGVRAGRCARCSFRGRVEVALRWSWWVRLGCCPPAGGCSHQSSRRGEADGVGRLGCRGMYPRRVRMMRSGPRSRWAHSVRRPAGRCWGLAVLRARNVTVSESHAAAAAGARQRISPSRRP
jgi:hypothetical protein